MVYRYPRDKAAAAEAYDRWLASAQVRDPEDDDDIWNQADREYDEMRDDLIRERYNEREA